MSNTTTCKSCGATCDGFETTKYGVCSECKIAQLERYKGLYEAVLKDAVTSDGKIKLLVEALERVPCTCADIRIGSDRHDDDCAQQAAQQALAAVKGKQS